MSLRCVRVTAVPSTTQTVAEPRLACERLVTLWVTKPSNAGGSAAASPLGA